MAVQTSSRQATASPSAQPIAELSPDEKRALLGQLLRKKTRDAQPFHPLSDNQQGIWFLHQFAPENSIYNVSFAERIRSQVLVDRPPSLRATFAVQAGKPVQRIHDHQTVQFEETDASTWREDERYRDLKDTLPGK